MRTLPAWQLLSVWFGPLCVSSRLLCGKGKYEMPAVPCGLILSCQFFCSNFVQSRGNLCQSRERSGCVSVWILCA